MASNDISNPNVDFALLTLEERNQQLEAKRRAREERRAAREKEREEKDRQRQEYYERQRRKEENKCIYCYYECQDFVQSGKYEFNWCCSWRFWVGLFILGLFILLILSSVCYSDYYGLASSMWLKHQKNKFKII